MLWDNSLEEKLDHGMRGIESLEYKVKCLNYYFAIYVLQLLVRYSDNFSKALQISKMSPWEGQTLTAISMNTLEKPRNGDFFDFIWDLTKCNTGSLDIPELISQENVKNLPNI